MTIFPPRDSHPDFRSEDNIVVGNVCLYGATSGRVFFRGVAAERFCVRNSGAVAVVEGVGDHGCEYMTGGRSLILGPTGRNFAAGMSGGIAFVYDKDGRFDSKCNKETVELLPLELDSDCDFVKEVLNDFVKETGSVVAQTMLSDWEAARKRFVKVFPYEYQRALKEMEAEANRMEVDGADNKVKVVAENGSGVPDIESVVADGEMASRKQEQLDKKRGFVIYRRESRSYRPAEKRMNDWEEIYDFGHLRRGLRKQAARCMDCGVPFCHSTAHGCPLGNIIPKFNDLVFQQNWKEALHTLLQVRRI